MKSIFTQTLLVALAAGTTAFGQTEAKTKPVGYVTEKIKASSFNLIGITLQKPVIVSGTLDAVVGSAVTDTGSDFDALLSSGDAYILKIISASNPALNGVIQEITQWGSGSGNSAGTLVAQQNLQSLGVQVGDSFELRSAVTLPDLFGLTNQAGLLGGGSVASADVIWVPSGNGNFNKYYYKSSGLGGTGWRSSTNADATRVPIVCTDAIFVERRAATDLNLVISGEVTTVQVQSVVDGGYYNYLSSNFPVGSTLATSGLQSFVLGGGTLASADELWFPDGSGGYVKCFYKNSGLGGTGWRTSTNASADSQVITSGFILRRKSASGMATLLPPAGYSGL